MPFTIQKLQDGNYEVIMKAGTISSRPRVDRRFAYCTHENDAEVIVDCLNNAEKLSILKQN